MKNTGVYYISALSCHTAPVGHNSVGRFIAISFTVLQQERRRLYGLIVCIGTCPRQLALTLAQSYVSSLWRHQATVFSVRHVSACWGPVPT